MDNIKKRNYEKIFECIAFLTFLFFVGSFIGGIIEITFILLTEHRICFSGFMYFMWRPMYGWATILLYLLLNKFENNWFKAFIIALLSCTIFEYLTSVALEIFYHNSWWDYSSQPLNINGRVCLFISLGWGVLGVIFAKIILPTLEKIYNKINKKYLYIGLIILVLLYKVDEIFSFIHSIK